MSEASASNIELSKEKAKTMDTVLELRGISKVYDGITVVQPSNFAIRKGEFVTFLGPSGCGKSTLLKMIAGFVQPSTGQVFINGVDVTELPPHLRPVNTVFQDYALFPHLDVFGNIAFGLRLKHNIPADKLDRNGKPRMRKFTKDEIQAKVESALRMVGLEEFGHREVTKLSGGQQQRVAIARALVNEPQLLLLDEPLGALDLKMRKEMQVELMDMHNRLGISFLYVTHDQEEALTMSNTVVVMEDGVMQQAGTPKEVYSKPVNTFVANFIGESNVMNAHVDEQRNIVFTSGYTIPCNDDSLKVNESADVVVRPEHVTILPLDDARRGLEGKVISSIFKGNFYDINVQTSVYDFAVHSSIDWSLGSSVKLYIESQNVHLMHKAKVINEFRGEIVSKRLVNFCKGNFECEISDFKHGDKVLVSVPFDKVMLLHDENYGVIAATVSDRVYKGSYYKVTLWTDDGTEIISDSPDDWGVGDRVGVYVKPADIVLEKIAENSKMLGNTQSSEIQERMDSLMGVDF